MNTTKLTSLFAMLTMAASVAIAQPPPPAPNGEAPPPPRGERGEGRGERRPGGEAGPFAKLFAASKIATLTPEQKTKVDALVEQKKADAETMRTEMRTAMEAARGTTDREARRAAMEPLRARHEAAQKEVDAALVAILTPEQMTELNQKADQMRQAGRERMGGRRGADDANTTGSDKAEWGKKDKAGKKGEGKGKKGKKAPHADSASTGTQTVNPFSE